MLLEVKPGTEVKRGMLLLENDRVEVFYRPGEWSISMKFINELGFTDLPSPGEYQSWYWARSWAKCVPAWGLAYSACDCVHRFRLLHRGFKKWFTAAPFVISNKSRKTGWLPMPPGAIATQEKWRQLDQWWIYIGWRQLDQRHEAGGLRRQYHVEWVLSGINWSWVFRVQHSHNS